MHEIQRELLQLSQRYNLGAMKLKDIQGLLQDKSTHLQRIKHHLAQLAKRGLIRIDKEAGVIERIKSGIEKKSNIVSVPILGAANCGEATMLAEDNIEGFLKVSRSILEKTKDIFAIRAVGSSMNHASIGSHKDNIEDGDYVIVDSQNRAPCNGDYIVSIIDGLANIKKFIHDKKNQQVVLVSESNHDYPPIYIHENDNYNISGIVIHVLKKPI